MSTASEDMTGKPRSGRRINRSAVIGAVLIGLVMCAAAIVGGDVVLGVAMLGIMLAVAAFIGIASRYSDTIALMGDDVHDERHVHVHQRSALYTLNILAAVIVGAAVFDIARGGDGGPYTWLAAVSGVTYVVFLLALSRRS